MIRTLAATLTIIGLALATISESISLAALGVVLLGAGVIIILRHPEIVED